MSGKIQKQLESLINRINQLDNQYYVLDNPIVSDEEYDQIYRQLKILEENNPSLIDPCSPTQRVSGGVLSQFVQVKHDMPMLSLNNAIDQHEFLAFYKRTLRAGKSKSIDFVGELKSKYSTVGAFQTRNIPHFGHEKIIEMMLDHCDHVVVNPIAGPKKTGDVRLENLEILFKDLLANRFNGRVSFKPIYANMFYAGPREAADHAIL